MKVYPYDFIVLGFGKAGKTLADALAAKGLHVALVEKSAGMYGGTCINVGCIPSKSLVNAAAHAALHADEPFEEKARRYRLAIAEKRRVTAMLRDKNYHKLSDLPNVTVYTGTGSFVNSTQVQVQTQQEQLLLQAPQILINTGACAVVPPIAGLQDNPLVYTSETLMERDDLPRRLTLIGAGYIGMEFASMYTSFGSTVTVLQDGAEFLPKEDRDVAEAVEAMLKKRGVTFTLGAQITRVEGGTVYYRTEAGAEQAVESDAILVAAGRKPNTQTLQTEKAGITLSPRGAVPVDEHLRTVVPHIFAAGDVTGGLQFTYVSLDDSRIILSQLDDAARTTQQRTDVPYSVFMDTPLARVGLTEAQARQKGLACKVVKLPTAAIPKAQVLGKTDGFLKALIDPETGCILGAALLCPESFEMINLIKLAMDCKLPYTALRDRIYTHPTMTEAFNDLFSL